MSTNQTKTTNTIRLALALALACATTLVACEDDTPPPALKAKPPVTETGPAPQARPTAEVTPPPAPPVAPEVKPEAVQEPEKPLGALAGARKALDDGEVDEAFRLAGKAVRETPKRSAAWNTLGRVQLRLGKRKDAIASFEQAVDLNPRNSYAQNNLGLALIYDKRYEEAALALEQAVELEPVTAYMWNNLGLAYEQLDRLDDARDAFSKAAEMDSDRARASLARLKGVESVIRTARAEPEPKVLPDTPADKTDKIDAETPTVTQ